MKTQVRDRGGRCSYKPLGYFALPNPPPGLGLTPSLFLERSGGAAGRFAFLSTSSRNPGASVEVSGRRSSGKKV